MAYIHDLLNEINNRTKFQFNRTRTCNFQLKLFDTAVILKYNLGHWKWYEWVKLNKYYCHIKFDIYYTYSVRENCNVTVFATYGLSGGRSAKPGWSYRLTFFMWVNEVEWTGKAAITKVGCPPVGQVLKLIFQLTPGLKEGSVDGFELLERKSLFFSNRCILLRVRETEKQITFRQFGACS